MCVCGGKANSSLSCVININIRWDQGFCFVFSTVTSTVTASVLAHLYLLWGTVKQELDVESWWALICVLQPVGLFLVLWSGMQCNFTWHFRCRCLPLLQIPLTLSCVLIFVFGDTKRICTKSWKNKNESSGKTKNTQKNKVQEEKKKRRREKMMKKKG